MTRLPTARSWNIAGIPNAADNTPPAAGPMTAPRSRPELYTPDESPMSRPSARSSATVAALVTRRIPRQRPAPRNTTNRTGPAMGPAMRDHECRRGKEQHRPEVDRAIVEESEERAGEEADDRGGRGLRRFQHADERDRQADRGPVEGKERVRAVR